MINILTVQECTRVYKSVQDYYLWRILNDSEKLVCLFPLIDDRWHSLHTLVKHTFISCTLSNLYMVIWIGTSLMMIVKQNYTTFFKKKTKPMQTWLTDLLSGIHKMMYEIWVIVQGYYTNCTK